MATAAGRPAARFARLPSLNGGHAGASARQARGLTDRLIGLPIPPVVLDSLQGFTLNLCEFADTFPIVIYFYPGGGWSPQDGEQTQYLDALERRAFRDHQLDLQVRQYRAVGVSGQAERSREDSAPSHLLLSDPELLLARELRLPTFTFDGTRWYQRLTMIASFGMIEKVFFPIADATRSAAQVVTWMQTQGI
jgi:peroxiredoxin